MGDLHPVQRCPVLQEVEAGLGLPTSAPTAQELQAGQQMGLEGGPGSGHARLLQQLRQQHAAADAEGQAAIEAALVGSFGNRLPPEELAALAAQARATHAIPQCNMMDSEAACVLASGSGAPLLCTAAGRAGRRGSTAAAADARKDGPRCCCSCV